MKIDIFGMIFTFLKIIFQMFSFLIPPVLTLIFVFAITFLYYCRYYRKKEKIVPKKRSSNKIKTPNIFKTIFVLFPKQLAYDFLTQDPEAFQEFGIHIVCGPQGAGKTMTAVYLLDKWRLLYPKMQIYTNLEYKYENGELGHWKELIERENGIYGIVNVIDEIQTWFSNKESKDLPPEVLGEISQQRKQKKAIIGTAQVFSKVAKPLREQTHFVYVPKTILGCLTIVYKARATDYDYEKEKFKKTSGIFIFAHNKHLRESYDTYKRIQRYKDTEFSPSIISGTMAPSLMEDRTE